MKPPIKITLDNPCHEAWEKMESRPCGAFCNSCNKEVIDFTTKTNSEIYDILTASSGKLCGRFHHYQLQNPIVKQEVNKSYFNIKAIAASLASLIGLQAIGMDNDNTPKPIAETKAADTATIPPIVVKDSATLGIKPITNPKEETPYSAYLPCQYVLQGKIIDNRTGEPIQDAAILIDGLGSIGISDSTGSFRIVINEKTIGTNNPLLKFKHVSYADKVYTAAEVKQQQTVCLDRGDHMLDIVEVTTAPAKNSYRTEVMGNMVVHLCGPLTGIHKWSVYKRDIEHLKLAKRTKLFFLFVGSKLKHAFTPKNHKRLTPQ